MPNKIAISGHSVTPRPGTAPEGDLWGLSITRANAVRETLANAGVPNSASSNRRVGIVLRAEAPALPDGLKP